MAVLFVLFVVGIAASSPLAVDPRDFTRPGGNIQS